MDIAKKPIRLDGTTLEGGGQLLRLALSFSSLTHIPLQVYNIRGNRAPTSGRGAAGGLKGSHLAAVEWLAKATGATTEGAELKSRELLFEPGRIADPSKKGKSGRKKYRHGKGGEDASVWHDVYEDGRLVQRRSEIRSPTPGSIFLILQAILPYLLFSVPLDLDVDPSTQTLLNPASPEHHTAARDEQPVPLRIRITGGTNVDKSPSYDYVSHVLFPILRDKLHLHGHLSLQLEKRGYTHGGNVIGSVLVDVTPLPRGSVLPPFSLRDRGAVTKFHACILAPNAADRASISSTLVAALSALYPHAPVEFPVSEDSRNPKRLYLCLVAETDNGYRLGRDWMYNRNARLTAADPAQKLRQLVEKVVEDLQGELERGGCVDEFLQDQLVVFQALAGGKSIVDDSGRGKKKGKKTRVVNEKVNHEEVEVGKQGTGSLHTQTVRWVTEQVLGVRFDDDGSCEGVGFRVGEKYWERRKVRRGDGDDGEVDDVGDGDDEEWIEKLSKGVEKVDIR